MFVKQNLAGSYQRKSRQQQAGLTLIELMVGMLVSLLVLLALTTFFVNGMRARAEMNRSNELVENGRYTLQLMTRDLQNAGYFGEFDLALAEASMDFPADLPNPCAADLASLDFAIPFHIQGFDGDVDINLGCISDWKSGTDVVVVRRLSSCFNTDPGCTVVAGAPYFQASQCNGPGELQSADSDEWFRLHTQAAPLIKTWRDCVSINRARRFRTHIYFVANNDISGDGIPTLKRAELGAGGFSIVPLANGVESFQIEYGVDTNGDSAPDGFTADPSVFNGCADADCRILNWRDVTAVKLAVLMRSLSGAQKQSVKKSFNLGLDVAGNDVVLGPFDDKFKRHAFHSVVALKSVVGRRR
ncbi:MAG: PilW family protein [Oceanococcus sp.]